MEKLKFRRQFFLSESLPNRVPDYWNHNKINCNTRTWNLVSHPDLEINILENNLYKLVLLGYLLDPFNPKHSNFEILEDIARQPDLMKVIERTHKLNGRFILFYIDQNSFNIFNDATGFRELFFLTDQSKIHCGSTADIIRQFVDIEIAVDDEALEFFKSGAYINNNYTWIGYDTLYKNIKRLVPNFMLEVISGKVQRFWPAEPIPKRKPDEIIQVCSEFLKGCFLSLSYRSQIHMGVTAGWDTRLLLAASGMLKDEIFYYINMHSGLSKSHPDVRISEALSDKLGFTLNKIIIQDIVVDEEFSKILYNNNFRANNLLLNVFYYGYLNKFDNTVTVSGNLAEGISRGYFQSPLKLEKIDADHFRRCIKVEDHPYVNKVLTTWVKDAKALCREMNIDIFDFYQVEMEASNWCHLSSALQEIIREEMRPFNSRYLINLFWSLDNKYRFNKNPRIYKYMIKYLWKETLQVPVNPSFVNKVFGILSFFRLEILANKLFLWWKYLYK